MTVWSCEHAGQRETLQDEAAQLSRVGCDVSVLRQNALSAARSSMSFFAQRVLGLRSLTAFRLAALQGGAAPRTATEVRAVRLWEAFRLGQHAELPPVARFVLTAAAAEGSAA